MYLYDPRAERALILAMTRDGDFADAVAARRATPPEDGGWLDATAPDIVARVERRAIELCAEILDLPALTPRLREAERPALAAGVRQVVRSAHAAYVACRALTSAAERADEMTELAA
jgi:hypothetical protein